MSSKLNKRFEALFDTPAEFEYFAPGRINLIGEHLDYHGGKVLPAAITLGTSAAVSKRNDQEIHLYSMNFHDQGIRVFDINHLVYDAKDDWTNYVKGSIKVLEKEFDHGLNIVFYGDIPNGAGLSSSASIEVLTLWIMNDVYNLGISRTEVALLGQKAENEFVGVNSGIMDQFAVAHGAVDKAIILDTGTLEFEHIPTIMNDVSIVIMNTNKRRGLEDSDYNLRRTESEEAFKILNVKGEKKYLTEFIPSKLDEIEVLLSNTNQFKRVRHVILEHHRVLEAVEALKNNHLHEFGKLLNESHASLKDDYEVTGIELDTLVESALKQKGVLGARMTGAGFGGAAIALVENDKIQDLIHNVGHEYKKVIGYDADFYIANIGPGVRKQS